MFDLYTKLFDLANVPVHAINVSDLIAIYDLHHPRFVTWFDPNEKEKDLQMKKKDRHIPDAPASDINVYDLIQFFLEHQMTTSDNSHFIVDEIPIIYRSKTGKLLT